MNFECRRGNTIHHVVLDEEIKKATAEGFDFPYEVVFRSENRLILRSGTKLYRLNNTEVRNSQVSFSLNGRSYVSEVKDEQELLLEKLGITSQSSDTQGVMMAPMPGRIIGLPAAVGETLAVGDPVIILEAMKMENELKAPVGGRLATLHVKMGQSVEKNQQLAEIETRG